MSGGTGMLSCSPMILSSTPSNVSPADIEGFRLMEPSTLVGGVAQPLSILNICSEDWTVGVVYSMDLSSPMPAMSFVSGLECPWLLLLASALGLPARLEGEYRHSMPHARHREQMGLALEHLTLARKHPSHEARRRGWRALAGEAMVNTIYDRNASSLRPKPGM